VIDLACCKHDRRERCIWGFGGRDYFDASSIDWKRILQWIYNMMGECRLDSYGLENRIDAGSCEIKFHSTHEV
jgi:hypothetical protein